MMEYVTAVFFIGLVLGAGYSKGDSCSDTCEEGEPVIPFDPANPDVFDDLSVDEITRVTNYLLDEFDLTPLREASADEPFIYLVERWHNTKTEALAYLDEGAAKPRREARAILYRPDLDPPVVEEYRVYPLPNPTHHEPLRNSKWRHPIPYSARPLVNFPQENELVNQMKQALSRIDHILRATTGGYSFNNCSDKCLTWFPGTPAYFQSGQSKIFVFLERDIDGAPIYPIGFQGIFNMKFPRSSEWGFEKIWYQGREFESLDDLIDAYEDKSFIPPGSPEPENVGTKNLVGSMNFRGDPQPKKPQRGPQSYSPDGRRFTVKGHHVDWQWWSFHVNHRTSSGPMIHDLRFRNERIAYELSLQELSVYYSGSSPTPLYNFYFDSLSLTGTRVNKLFHGTDCPEEAVYMDVSHYVNGRPILFKDAVCVFELDKGIPVRRHFESNLDGGYKWYQGMRDIVLVTRSVLTIYNYDYIIDLMLHQTGQVEGKVTLSGYTINTFYTGPEMDEYGFQTQTKSLANIHQHLVNFKVDLDVAGRENRFQTLDLKVKQVRDSFLETTTATRYFVKSLKATEKEAAYQFNFETPKYLVQFNNDAKNKYGYEKGYRIVSDSMTKMLISEDDRTKDSWAWAKYQVAVTKYNEEEPRSSSLYMSQDMFDPIVSFQSNLDDNDNIVDEDLVTWITMGTHHIPHSEDVPVVNTPGVQLTFYLLPYNYFDEDPSLSSRDNLRVEPREDGTDDYQYAGVKPDACCTPRRRNSNGHMYEYLTVSAHADNIIPSTLLNVILPFLLLCRLWY